MNAVSVGIFAVAIQAAALLSLCFVRVSAVSLLPRLLVVIYSMPFIALTGYLAGEGFIWWETPAMELLCADLEVMTQMLVVAACGLFGMLTGIFFYQATRNGASCRAAMVQSSGGEKVVLGILAYLGVIFLAIAFSAMHARPQSILSAGYATQQQGVSLAVDTGFNAAYLVSYLLILVAAVDLERENANSQRARLKKFILRTSVFVIVIFFQLLCGDRECIGLLVALAVLRVNYFQAHGGVNAMFLQLQMRRLRKLMIPAVIVVGIFFGLGFIRNSLSEGISNAADDALAVVDRAYRKNTWTAVAINNAGVANEMLGNGGEILYGKTYLDYLYSLPPGVVCRLLGLERPIERLNGPVWWYPEISAGGIHVTVVPYRNFGIVGLMLVMFAIGWGGCVVEQGGQDVGGWRRMLYASVIMSSFMWFWYGDMIFIRAIMGACLFWGVYSVLAVVPVRLGKAGLSESALYGVELKQPARVEG